jgi:excinuclease ABC subunit C
MIKSTDKLKEKLKMLPELPGVYKMLDSKQNIIYIGKSKCLKNRVKSYFVSHPKWEKVERMVSMIDDFEFIVTDTHLEARLLECELIKAIKPAFNSQMKRDTGYVYLKLEEDYKRNPLAVVVDRTENSYGPFRSRFKLTELTTAMKNIYPIHKSCSGYEFEYHMMPAKLDKTALFDNRNILLELLSDSDCLAELIRSLEVKMNEEASLYQYESAVRYRDLITGLTLVLHGINGYKELSTKNILLNIPAPGGNKLFFISRGVVRYKQLYSLLSEPDIEQFTSKGREISDIISPELGEKSAIDFRDILYSEILSLPDSMVTVIG